MFKCYECGKKFITVKAAEKASHDGCPKCGGVDIDVDYAAAGVTKPTKPKPAGSLPGVDANARYAGYGYGPYGATD